MKIKMRGTSSARTGPGGPQASTRDSTWSASSLRGLAGLSIACGLLVLSGAGCGGDRSSSAETMPSLPPEVAAQLGEIERLMNGDRLAEAEAVFSESARIHLAGRLAYGSREDLLGETLRRDPAVRIEFGPTEVVSQRPDRIRTVTRMSVMRGEERSNERISHEWIPMGEGWIACEQSYPDWSPIVGDWQRLRLDGEGIGLRLLPNGQFELRLDGSDVVERAGTYAISGETLSLVPDAVGAGGVGGGSLELAHRFEFDGSLVLESSDGSMSEQFEGAWRRRRLVD